MVAVQLVKRGRPGLGVQQKNPSLKSGDTFAEFCGRPEMLKPAQGCIQPPLSFGRETRNIPYAAL